ncbi:hypothetical protein KGY79_11840, partial [Candidatus Bipolaricaulota bacterium]|nr:hypothetical protein [Candidatus Bipolaricaulota bacterium]
MKYPVWSKSAFLTFILSALLVTSLLTSPIMADEHKVTVPINQVVKTEKLSAEQLAKSEVTVPISWVSESYLEEHNLIGKKSSQAKQEESESPSNNIPDGTYTRKPKITSDQNESIDLSNFHFEFSYDEGDLQKST